MTTLKVVCNWRYKNQAEGLYFEEGDRYELEEELVSWLNRDSPGVVTVEQPDSLEDAPPYDRMMKRETPGIGLRDISTITDSLPDEPTEMVPEPDATPSAVKLAHEKGVDLGDVTGTGAGGRIIARDVRTYLKIQDADAQPDAKFGATKSGDKY